MLVLSANILETAVNIFNKYWLSFVYGLQFTLIISIVGTVVGLFIGLLVGGFRAVENEADSHLLKRLSKKILMFLSKLYIEVFRGTPMMVQAVFIYHSLRPIINWTPLLAGMVIVSINTGAYMSEIIRAGIQAVDKGQKEAARSLGMSGIQTMLYVIIPQAIKNSFPAMGNELIVNIKDSSVLNVISVTELFFQSSSIAGSVFKYKETFLVTALIYLLLTIIFSNVLKYIENKLNNTKSSYPSSDTSIVNKHIKVKVKL